MDSGEYTGAFGSHISSVRRIRGWQILDVVVSTVSGLMKTQRIKTRIAKLLKGYSRYVLTNGIRTKRESYQRNQTRIQCSKSKLRNQISVSIRLSRILLLLDNESSPKS